ncbi:MAG TPA: hypothetical protein VE862_01885 [Candidatus Acidoferrum sp.]|nr:hypothetical protein [Candidatus Acidoferrum sp.]
MALVRILFATDLHGSTKAFLKFLKAIKLYKANVGILGGDLTGKLIVAIEKQENGTYHTEFMGRSYQLDSDVSLNEIMVQIQDTGYYAFVASKDEIQRFANDPQFASDTFNLLAAKRLEEWMHLAKPRLEGTGINVYFTGGNDDRLELDDVLRASETMIFAESRVVTLEGEHEMISTGYTNITPWKCPRDIPEEELYVRIEKLAEKVTDLKSAIFNLHAPPKESTIDVCTKLDTSFDPPRALIGQETPGGSAAVRKAIETFQPLAGLHGHIHEARGVDKIGRTLCFNPGSEYTEGTLKSVVLNVSKEKVESYQFLSG